MRMDYTRCFHCLEKFARGTTDYRMLPLEHPYVNLFFHRGCFAYVMPDITVYLSENAEKLYNYTIEQQEKSQK